MAEKKKKKKWMQDLDIKEGAFSEKAKRAGMSTSEYANKVLAPGSKGTEKTKKQARLAKVFAKSRKKKK